MFFVVHESIKGSTSDFTYSVNNITLGSNAVPSCFDNSPKAILSPVIGSFLAIFFAASLYVILRYVNAFPNCLFFTIPASSAGNNFFKETKLPVCAFAIAFVTIFKSFDEPAAALTATLCKSIAEVTSFVTVTRVTKLALNSVSFILVNICCLIIYFSTAAIDSFVAPVVLLNTPANASCDFKSSLAALTASRPIFTANAAEAAVATANDSTAFLPKALIFFSSLAISF